MKITDTGYGEASRKSGWNKEYTDRVMKKHRGAAELDHPDGSVTEAKIADDAVTDEKIGDRLVFYEDKAHIFGERITASLTDHLTSLYKKSSEREAQDVALQTKLDAETAAREGADAELAGKLAEEKTARESGDNEAYALIDNERSNRSRADNTLQNQINSLAGADGLLQTQIANLVTAVNEVSADNTALRNLTFGDEHEYYISLQQKPPVYFDGDQQYHGEYVTVAFDKKIPIEHRGVRRMVSLKNNIFTIPVNDECYFVLNYISGEKEAEIYVSDTLVPESMSLNGITITLYEYSDAQVDFIVDSDSPTGERYEIIDGYDGLRLPSYTVPGYTVHCPTEYVGWECTYQEKIDAADLSDEFGINTSLLDVVSYAYEKIDTLGSEAIIRPDNAIYVYCDGQNDAAKINAALGENAAESTEQRIVYLVGDCVLDASDLILDESSATKAYVIRPCANVIFDGTYCTSLTWDGSAEVANSVAYCVFNFTKGSCGFRNMHIKYVNMDNAWYAPAFIYYGATEDKGSFIMRDMVIEDMQAGNNRYLIIISGAARSLVENVTFKRLTIKSRNTSVQCMTFGSCDFVNNKFYGVTYSNANVFATKFITLSKYSRFENNYFENVDASSALRIDISTNSTFKNNMFYTCYVAPQVTFENGCVIAENNYRDCTVKDYMIYANSNALATIKDNFFEKLTLAGASSIFAVSHGSLANNSVHIWKLEEGALMYSIAEIYCNMYYTNIIGNTITFNSSITFPENFAPFDIYTEFDTGAFIEKNYTNAPTLMTTNGDGEIISKDNVIVGETQA